jgi:tetratricopeptide (TPR) repeat protein
MLAFMRADSLLATAQLAAPEWLVPTLERADLALARVLGGPSARDVAEPPADVLAEGLRYTADVLENDPQNVRALTVRGELHFRLWEVLPGRPDSLLDLAVLELEKATAQQHSLPRAWYLLSDALLSKGRVAESRIAAERALREDVYAEQAAATFAQLFFSALYENRAAADSICSLGRLRYPGHPNFIECELTLIGWYGAGTVDVRRARMLVARLDSMPRLADARISRRLLLAAVLARSGDRSGASAELDAAHALASEPIGASRFGEPAAYVTLLLGDTAGSIELLRMLVAADPAAGPWLADHPWFRTISHTASFRELVSRR